MDQALEANLFVEAKERGTKVDKVKVEAKKAQKQEVESGQKAEKAKQIETRETTKRLKVCAQACLHTVCCVLLQYLLLTVGRLSVMLAASLTVSVPCFHHGSFYHWLQSHCLPRLPWVRYLVIPISCMTSVL